MMCYLSKKIKINDVLPFNRKESLQEVGHVEKIVSFQRWGAYSYKKHFLKVSVRQISPFVLCKKSKLKAWEIFKGTSC